MTGRKLGRPKGTDFVRHEALFTAEQKVFVNSQGGNELLRQLVATEILKRQQLKQTEGAK